MKDIFKKHAEGYQKFRMMYHEHDNSIMKMLAKEGQRPHIMVVACCDSRVDPAILLQCEPGDLFVLRNVANIIPPYENDEFHHGTSAALEFAICYLGVKHLIILGHSQCGGLHAALNQDQLDQDDFISHWVSLAKSDEPHDDECALAKTSLNQSYKNCLTFPWIKQRLEKNQLSIHRWYFDIETAEIYEYSEENQAYELFAS